MRHAHSICQMQPKYHARSTHLKQSRTPCLTNASQAEPPRHTADASQAEPPCPPNQHLKNYKKLCINEIFDCIDAEFAFFYRATFRKRAKTSSNHFQTDICYSFFNGYARINPPDALFFPIQAMRIAGNVENKVAPPPILANATQKIIFYIKW